MRKPHIRFSIAWILALWISFSFQSALATCALNQSETPSVQVQRGVDLYRQHKFADAASVLKRAVKQNKTDSDAWYYLGLALIQDLKQLKDASKAFETAAKLSPNFAAAHTGLAYTLLLRDKTNDAAREAQLALKIEPTIADAYYIFGVTRLRAGAKEDALQNAEAAIKLQPRLAPAYLLKSEALASFLGDVLISEGAGSSETRKNRYREAAEALQKFLDLSPDASDKKTWSEQLESLRFYINDVKAGDSKLAYSGKGVDTKARVLSKPGPVYTELARAKGTIGTVILRCVFTSDGKVKHLLIVQALPFGLTEQAIKAAGKIKFIPAMKDGRPVATYIQLEYNFNLY